MWHRKKNLVIGLTTFHNEMLRISVPALGKLKQKFLLIIYNDNPTTCVSRRNIRRLGYHGDLLVINGTENIDTLRSRFAIVNRVKKMRTVPKWMLFVNDEDILTRATIPNVSDDIFAVIQNSLSLRRRVVDLIFAIQNPQNCIPDGENIILNNPHIGFCGTFIRTDVLIKLVATLDVHMDKILEIDSGFGYRPPYDSIMWNWVNNFAHILNPNAAPIYMNSVNYVSNDIDSATVKYGRAIMPAAALKSLKNIVLRFDSVLTAALRGDIDEK